MQKHSRKLVCKGNHNLGWEVLALFHLGKGNYPQKISLPAFLPISLLLSLPSFYTHLLNVYYVPKVRNFKQ